MCSWHFWEWQQSHEYIRVKDRHFEDWTCDRILLIPIPRRSVLLHIHESWRRKPRSEPQKSWPLWMSTVSCRQTIEIPSAWKMSGRAYVGKTEGCFFYPSCIRWWESQWVTVQYEGTFQVALCNSHSPRMDQNLSFLMLYLCIHFRWLSPSSSFSSLWMS